MISQWWPQLNPHIEKYGCLWMSYLWYGWKFGGHQWQAAQIVALYRKHVNAGWITENCWVKRPDEILEDIDVPCQEDMREVPLEWEPPHPKAKVVAHVMYQAPRPETEGHWQHWMATDGCGHVTYDPWGHSRTYQVGEPTRRVVALV
jgi:hypothetical protein